VECSPPEDTGGVNGPAVFCGVKRDAARVNENAPADGARPGAGGVRAAEDSPPIRSKPSSSADRVTSAEATRIPPPKGEKGVSS
jgi:hypothetical protein